MNTFDFHTFIEVTFLPLLRVTHFCFTEFIQTTQIALYALTFRGLMLDQRQTR